LHSMYLMPISGFCSNSLPSSERGGVTDTYD
jgi:hypothetical protein